MEKKLHYQAFFIDIIEFFLIFVDKSFGEVSLNLKECIWEK